MRRKNPFASIRATGIFAVLLAASSLVSWGVLTAKSVALPIPQSHDTLTAGKLFVFVEGDQQGWIEGDVTRPRFEGMIRGHCFELLNSIPEDCEGRPGSNEYGSLRFQKPIDQATPLLLTALWSSELLKVRFHLFTPGKGTTLEIHLENAQLASSRTVSVEDDEGQRAPQLRQELELVFERIRWRDPSSGSEFED